MKKKININLPKKQKDTTGRITIITTIIIWLITTLLALLFLKEVGLIIGVIWGLIGFFQVDEKHMGAIFFFGKRARIVGPGLHWTLVYVEKKNIVTRSQIMHDYAAGDVITKRGKINDQEIGAAELKIDASIYYTWPDYSEDNGKNLFQALELAPFFEEEKLKEYLKPSFLGALRKIAGSITWIELNEERDDFEQNLINCLKGVGTGQTEPTAFERIGFSNIDVNIKDVELPEGLKNGLINLEDSRLSNLAATHRAEAEKKVIQAKGEAQAETRKLMLEAIQEAGTEWEVLLTLREMAQGTSNTILYQIPGVFADKIATMLGGNAPGNLLTQIGGVDGLKKLIPELEKLTKK